MGDTGSVHVCAVEVYCERVRDLLADCDAVGGEECDVLLTADRRTIIRHKRNRAPLVECEVGSVATAMNLLARALMSRAVDSTRYVPAFVPCAEYPGILHYISFQGRSFYCVASIQGRKYPFLSACESDTWGM